MLPLPPSLPPLIRSNDGRIKFALTLFFWAADRIVSQCGGVAGPAEAAEAGGKLSIAFAIVHRFCDYFLSLILSSPYDKSKTHT